MLLSIDELKASHTVGHALQQGFYTRDDVYEREVDRILLKSWILAGHQSQIPERGDFFQFHMAGESVIIVRSEERRISALVNVCRHRGSRVCLEDRGHAARFVCPYHAWTYGLDGKLLGAPRVMGDIDASQFSLRQVQVENLHGMLFVNFDASADFRPVAEDLDNALRPYDLANTKIAHRQNYEIDANWKLGVENFCECYHCMPAHREYAVGHGLARPEKVDQALRDAVTGRADACGLSSRMFDVSWRSSEPIGTDRYYGRYPLLKGHVTGSRDGKRVAPLLGSIRDYDGGASDFQVGAVSYGLAYCDYVVLYRFIPISRTKTDCEVIWLVRDDAVENEDYVLDDLIWLWDVTTIADKRIIQDNSKGVNSRFYEPGPFAPMENFTQQFTAWYLDVIAD